jgi:hypothetical protein
VVRACEQEYEALREEIEALERKPGILKLLLSTVIDIDLIISGMKEHEELRRLSQDRSDAELGVEDASDSDTRRSVDDGRSPESIPLNQITSADDSPKAV